MAAAVVVCSRSIFVFYLIKADGSAAFYRITNSNYSAQEIAVLPPFLSAGPIFPSQFLFQNILLRRDCILVLAVGYIIHIHL